MRGHLLQMSSYCGRAHKTREVSLHATKSMFVQLAIEPMLCCLKKILV